MGLERGSSRHFRILIPAASRICWHRKTVLYFGDLDYEGIRIYEKFAEKFAAAHGAQYDIRLFQRAYERMLAKADRIGIEDLPRTKEGQNRNIGSLFLGWFSHPQQTRIKAILEQDRYIPQEILNIQDMV